MLAEAVERLRPDVVLIEHYPFSKWELEPEMRALIGARALHEPGRPRRVLRSATSSGRRATKTRRLRPTRPGSWACSRSRFDAILVHADPAFTTLEQHFGRVADLPVPVHYTGFVVEAPGPRPSPAPPWPYAVLSCGGGAGNGEFLVASVQAFRGLSATGKLGAMRLVVFPEPFADNREAEALRAAAREAPVELRAFSPEFAGWLAGAELSVSRAGYNTALAESFARGRAACSFPIPRCRIRSRAPSVSASWGSPRWRRAGRLGGCHRGGDGGGAGAADRAFSSRSGRRGADARHRREDRRDGRAVKSGRPSAGAPHRRLSILFGRSRNTPYLRNSFEVVAAPMASKTAWSSGQEERRRETEAPQA